MRLPIAILAGGLATRLRPLTEQIPKSLLEIAGRPFAEHQLELLQRQGYEQVVFCVGHLGDKLQQSLGDGKRWGMRIDYAYDGARLLGTGGALRQAVPLLGEAFLVLYGDSYLTCDYCAVESAFRNSGRQGLMTVYRNDDHWDRSNVRFEAGRILCYDKQSRTEQMRHIDYGLGALHADALAGYPHGELLDLAQVYQDLCRREELSGFEVGERFYEIGSPEGLQELDSVLRNTSRGVS